MKRFLVLLTLMLLSFSLHAQSHSVTLSCVPSTTPGVTYVFYRGTVKGGPYTKLNVAPTCAEVDASVQSGVTYYYVATATDGTTESVNSNEVQALIPGPLVINGGTLPSGTVGLPYSATVVGSASGGAPPYSFSLTGAPTWLSVSPSGSLSGTPTGAASYAFSVVVTDATGASTSAMFNLAVIVAPPAPTTFMLWQPTDKPANVTGNDTASVELGTKFTTSVVGQVVGVQFYKPTNSAINTRTCSLWSSTGARLGSVTTSGETASGWQTANFPAPVSVGMGTYTASCHEQQYPWTTSYFNNTRVVAPLTAPVNAGVYVYGTAAAFPTSTFSGSNYFVGPVFSTVVVAPPPPAITVSVAPRITSLIINATQQFTATVANATNSAVNWSSTCGGINALGLFTTPNVTGSCQVKAISMQDATKSDAVSFTVNPPPPSLALSCTSLVCTIVPTNVPSGTAINVSVAGDGVTAMTTTVAP